jgi:hypothetical protein
MENNIISYRFFFLSAREIIIDYLPNLSGPLPLAFFLASI